jgi:HEPN domain-containing protein
VSTNPAAVTLTPAAGSVRADGVTDALAALQQAVELALKAITSGDPAQVVPAVTGLLGALVNAVKEIAGATGLPIPNLPLPTTS